VIKIKKLGHIENLEKHYRPCACRSTTPFFSERKHNQKFSHIKDQKGNQYRTFFQHDRDKILYCRSFRRLRLKSQIFPEHSADYLRTRLDHTLEVAQIARHFARQLRLNEDLVDAISLAHDIGHAPFAHSGERALHEFLKNNKYTSCDGFKHNWQGLRIVDKLEKVYPKIDGLDLTKAVRIAILKHTELNYPKDSISNCYCDMYKEIIKEFNPFDKNIDLFEIQLCRLSDDIAQVIHDFEDAIISNSIDFELVVKHAKYPIIDLCIKDLEKKGYNAKEIDFKDKDYISFLMSRIRSEMIYKLTLDILEYSKKALEDWEINQFGEVNEKAQIESFNNYVRDRKPFPKLIWFSKLEKEFEKLRKKLYNIILATERVSKMDGKAAYILKRILKVYLTSPKQLPNSIIEIYKKQKKINTDIRNWNEQKIKKLSNDPVFIRAVVDYVAGMTDRFALKEYDMLYSAYPRSEL